MLSWIFSRASIIIMLVFIGSFYGLKIKHINIFYHTRRLVKGFDRLYNHYMSMSDKQIEFLNKSKMSEKNTTPLEKMINIFYNDVYTVSLPENHRFPMDKYRIVREKLFESYSKIERVKFNVSPLASVEELASTHCNSYISRYINGNMTDKEIRKTGFPWSIQHVNRSLSSVGGTIAAMRSVMNDSSALFACHIAGGTHHAFFDYGEGYCIFNDIAVASNLALKEYPNVIKKILIIDLDVHQGNGNSVLFKDNPNVYTFSMHCKENYFSTIQTSDLDIELDVNTNDEEYINKLKSWMPYLIDIVKPDMVFYQAGVDISLYDRLGKLKVTKYGIIKRNNIIFNYLLKRNIKCVVTMGGGYPKDLNPESESFKDIVDCHFLVYKNCIESILNNNNTLV